MMNTRGFVSQLQDLQKIYHPHPSRYQMLSATHPGSKKKLRNFLEPLNTAEKTSLTWEAEATSRILREGMDMYTS